MSTMDKSYAEFAVEKTCELLAIDSPSGFTDKAAQWIKNEFSELGFPAVITAKGGVLIDLFGDDGTYRHSGRHGLTDKGKRTA